MHKKHYLSFIGMVAFFMTFAIDCAIPVCLVCASQHPACSTQHTHKKTQCNEFYCIRNRLHRPCLVQASALPAHTRQCNASVLYIQGGQTSSQDTVQTGRTNQLPRSPPPLTLCSLCQFAWRCNSNGRETPECCTVCWRRRRRHWMGG